MKFVILAAAILFPLFSFAQENNSNDDPLFDLSLEELLSIDLVDKHFYLYGYINSNVQKTFNYPSRDINNKTVVADDPLEFTPVKYFHIYGQGNLTDKISYLFNLARKDNSIEIRNAWGNFALTNLLQVRVGKMYRKFGLYNERLDQIPTFIGIEAPEMLDSDHLFLTRTTNFMVHGLKRSLGGEITYALMTENGEGGPAKGVVPLGWDLRYKSRRNSIVFGTSGFASALGNKGTAPSVAFGSGVPDGGILPWMISDKYTVLGLFIEKQVGNVLIQSEYYNARHSAQRDPNAVLQLVEKGNINSNQRQRFLGSAEGVPATELTTADVVSRTSYNVETFYVRLGYNLKTNAGQFVPYMMWDWMSHPEVIQNKRYGGDDESGLADDGKFTKPSIGLVYRPIPSVAVKLDGSYHLQNYNGVKTAYPELRLDFSFAFSNGSIAKAIGE